MARATATTGRPGSLPTGAFLALGLLAVPAGLVAATADPRSLAFTLPRALSELAVAGLIAAAAGGFGSLLIVPLTRGLCGRGLAAVTSVAAGLWMLATAILLAGLWMPDPFNPLIWWPLLVAGAAVTAWRGLRLLLAGPDASSAAPGKRPRLRLRDVELPAAVSLRWLWWLLPAAAAGIWLSGAIRPAGTGGLVGDYYDVLTYHLQVPREWLEAGRIGPLPHNVYSHYPMGLEALYLLGMILRGGAWEGVYLAKLMHGLYGVVAVAALAAGPAGRRPASRWAAGLLATAPFVLALSWTAMVELSQLAWLAVALAWLRLWIDRPSLRAGVVIGLALGASIGVKYLSVAFIAAPVGLAMIVLTVRRPRAAASTALAALVSVAAAAPWLARNVAWTGNPVFPLATRVFGPGSFAPEDEQRWIAGHAAAPAAPVPEPTGGLKPRPAPSRLALLGREFLGSPLMNPLLIVAALGAIAWLLARRERDPESLWQAVVAVILLVQVSVWFVATREMPGRFITPALVCLALLATGLLERLASLRRVGPRGAEACAWLMALTGLGIALPVSWHHQPYVPPYEAPVVAEQLTPWPRQAPHAKRILLVGSATAFYYPSGTLYATPFDARQMLDWLRPDLPPPQRLAHLKSLGVTHVMVHWGEIARLAHTYGVPHVLADGVTRAAKEGIPPRLPAIDDLIPLGVRPLPWLPDYGKYTLFVMPWADGPPAG